ILKIKSGTIIEPTIFEAISYFKRIIPLLSSKIEALTLIITELIKNQKIKDAEETYIPYQTKLNDLIQEFNDSVEAIEKIIFTENGGPSLPEASQKVFTNFKDEWTKQIGEFHVSFDNLERKIATQLDEWIEQSRQVVKENISRLQTFYKKIREKISGLDELIQTKKNTEAERYLRDMQDQTLQELNYQKVKFTELTSELKFHIEDLAAQWDKEIKNTEIAIPILISPFKSKLETVLIEENLSNIELLMTDFDKKSIEIALAITQKKYTYAEKELDTLDAQFKKNIEENRKILEHLYKNPPPNLEELVAKWKTRLSVVETEIQEQISNSRSKIRNQHQDELAEKVQMFISQNIKILNAALDKFKDDLMKVIKTPPSAPGFSIKREYNTKKKEMRKEFDDREKHIQLVFSRYAGYPLDDFKESWNTQLKTIQNRFNDIQTTIVDFLENKEKINLILDKYYAMAQPAYGYKVPLKLLADTMEMPVDIIENLFVNLISYNFVNGEIDPITKVIVLPPRVERISEQVSKQLRCMVCNLIINPSQEEVCHCPHCNYPAHYVHLVEWIKIKGKCPNCKREIKML
ncbi:MAG: hypothetical protein LUQ65_14675, partial [Candidatus Helarchaeota archaeon]|nr:hypothetical protein [Candidatus Helarchaeota archaeon]